MNQDEYQRHLIYLEGILRPLMRAKHRNWDAQSVSDLLDHLFSMAKKKEWIPAASRFIGQNGESGTPFFEYYKEQIGLRIWRATTSLSNERWTESKFKNLVFHRWPKPELSSTLPRPTKRIGSLEVSQGKLSPLTRANSVSRSERLRNRRAWNTLFRDVMLLNKKPGIELYENHPYSTYVFRFERTLFRDHIWQSVKYGVNNSDLCEYVLKPLYFSAVFAVRSHLPYRVSGRQIKKAESENQRIEILPLIDFCQYCLLPLKRSLGNRKVRSDSNFCPGNTCKNAYHRRKNPRRQHK